MPRHPLPFVAALLLAGPLAANDAQAVTYGFDCLTNNVAGDCTAGEAQLAVDVTDEGGGQVALTFTNAGPAASSIADVYVDGDGGSLLSIASIVSGPGTSFSEGAAPGNLPGGNTAIPPFTATFSADSNAPTQPNGVNPGESVSIVFDLVGGASFADVLAELADGTLRIGIHVQGFASGGSESFIHVIPEPGTAALLALGLGVMASRRRA